MLELDKSKNFENVDDSIERARRKYNTMQELEKDRKEEILTNSKDRQFQSIFSHRLNEMYNTIKEEKELEEKEFTQKDFADVLEISEATLSKYLTGKVIPKPNEIERIANVLNISPQFLYGLTDSTVPILAKSDLVKGLSPEARYSIYRLYYGIEDDDIGEIDINRPISNKYIGFLDIFSEFIGDFSDFCDFVSYLKRYVEVKQEINELEKNKDNVLDYLGTRENLDDQLLRNWGKITKDNI